MGLGKKVKDTLVSFITDVVDNLGDAISSIISTSLGFFADMVEKPLYAMIKWEWKALSGEDELPPQLKELTDKGEESNQVAFLAVLFPIALALVIALIMALAGTFMNKMTQEVNKRVPSALLPPDLIVMGIFRNLITQADIDHHMKRAGFDDRTTELYRDISRPRASPQEYTAMWLRGEYSDAEYETKLTELGFAEAEIEVNKTLAYFIPPVADLTRMAVREAFTPAVVQEYGLHEDFPPDFETEAAKQGVSPEWAKHYWAAHWELPSIAMSFEMFHRRIISKEQLEILLRIQDVMPFWRQPIIDVAYRPLSRVDVRRMYRVSVLNEQEVLDAYLDLGYSQQNAERMRDFTIAFETGSEKDLTKAELLRGYRESVLTREIVSTELVALGYSSDEAEYYLTLEDVKKNEEIAKFERDLIITQYRAGQIDDNGLIAELGKLELPAEQQELIVAKEQLRKGVKEAQPTREDVIRWYQGEIIDESQARDYLSILGYSDNLIDLYLVEVDRAPSVGTVLRWLIDERIDEGTARAYLKDLRYGSTEIDILITEATTLAVELPKQPPLAEIKKWFVKELIDESQTRNYLDLMGYGLKEIDLFIQEWTPAPEES